MSPDHVEILLGEVANDAGGRWNGEVTADILQHMNDSHSSGLGRRDFLGTLGLVLAAPLLQSPEAIDATQRDSGAIFSGSLRQLASSMRLDQGWKWEFDSLIESAGQPASEWIVGQQSRLSIAMDLCSLTAEGIASSLKAHGVRAQCEIDYSRREGDKKNEEDCFVEIVVCERQSQTRELWKQIQGCHQEWQLKPSPIAGEAMFISGGGNAIAGKTWFVRGNILASVVAFFVPHESSAEFAARLDKHICELLQKL